MMRWMMSGLFLTAAAMPVAVSADVINYTYSEISAVHMDVDDVDNSNGFRVAASLGITQEVYFYGDYSRVRLDINDQDRTAAIGNLGGGVRIPISEMSDVGLEATWIHSTRAVRAGESSRDGVRASFLTRMRPVDWVELGVRAGYTHNGPAGNGYVLGGNALFSLVRGIGVNVEALTYDGDVHVLSAGLRFSF